MASMGSLELHQNILPGLLLTVGIVLAIAETLELGTGDKAHRRQNFALGALLATVTSLYQPGEGSVLILHCTLFWVLSAVWKKYGPIWFTDGSWDVFLEYFPVAAILSAVMCCFWPHGPAAMRFAYAAFSTESWRHFLAVDAALVVINTVGLCAWSAYVQGRHGLIQDRLGPFLNMRTLPLFPLINAAIEELEFRAILLPALTGVSLTGTGSITELFAFRPLLALLIQATIFGLQHRAGGFPSGLIGTLLAGVFGFQIGVMRLYTGGLVHGYLVHVMADTVIALLVYREEQRKCARRQKKNPRRKRGPP
jgi:hypothetical protein